ncbi:uncharacterized protein LOC110847815 [Folsomia candida]|uniref:Uncharacterized protein n=1 Tax=Folsomia candida TaxID=158441 RepID=A0A226EH61_FOLCA|nr:uncharacterized protein LOC110847815 [Folsomia candida]OXA56779.1 hypothetical protein Fcan01_07654 [Folsomia candida]
MESRREDNPWKQKSRIELIAFSDIIVAVVGVIYSTYRMFTFYWNLETQDVTEWVKHPLHFPFYVFLWVVVLLLYGFQMGTSFVLYSAIDQEATESDPYISVQKCNCWLRCSRVLLGVIVIKLCLQPVIMSVGKFYNVYTIVFGFIELLFRCAAIFAVKGFIQDLQQ